MDNIEWLNSKKAFTPDVNKSLEPKVDMAITKAVGFKVMAQDPRLLKLIVKYKAKRTPDDDRPDNFLKNPEFITELKQELGQSL